MADERSRLEERSNERNIERSNERVKAIDLDVYKRQG